MDDNHQKLGSHKEARFPRAFRKSTARPTPLSPIISGILNQQRLNFCCFKPLSLCSLLWQPQEASATKLFCRSNCSRFGHWDIFQVNSCIPLKCSIICWINVPFSLLSFTKLLQLHHPSVCTHIHTYTHKHTHTLSLSLSHTHTHTHTHTHIYILNFSSRYFLLLFLGSQRLNCPPSLSLALFTFHPGTS